MLVAAGGLVTAAAHDAKTDGRLSKIGPAPDFALTAQDGRRLVLRDLRGKVVAVTFIYASCTDACPLLTSKLATLQIPLGRDFGARVQYASGDDQTALAAEGMVCSMSRRGNCWDNAVAESFFATLKVELVHDASWATRQERSCTLGRRSPRPWGPASRHNRPHSDATASGTPGADATGPRRRLREEGREADRAQPTVR